MPRGGGVRGEELERGGGKKSVVGGKSVPSKGGRKRRGGKAQVGEGGRRENGLRS